MAGIFTIGRGVRSVSRRWRYWCGGSEKRGRRGRNYNARARVNYDPKTLNRYWLCRAFILYFARSPVFVPDLTTYRLYVLTSPAASVTSHHVIFFRKKFISR